MSLASRVRAFGKRALRATGYRLVPEGRLLWQAPSLQMTQAWAARLVADRPVEVVFDVGANDGKSVELMRRLFPTARILSFEPYPPSFAALLERAKTFADLELFNVALGDRSGSNTYHANRSAGTGSLLPNAPRITSFAPESMVSPIGQVTVPVERLDHFCERNQIDRVDVLKIDTQGYEKRILDGAGELLHPARIRSLMLEVNFVELYEGQAWPDELFGLLRERGYRMYGLAGVNFSFEHGWHWADALFVAADS